MPHSNSVELPPNPKELKNSVITVEAQIKKAKVDGHRHFPRVGVSKVKGGRFKVDPRGNFYRHTVVFME